MSLDGVATTAALVTILLAYPVLGVTRLQGQTLRGIVSERQSYQPIELVSLVLLDAQGDTLGQAITDARGYFSFDLPESGEYSVVATGLGYQAMQSEPFRVGAGEVRIVELSMDTRPLPVEGMVVEARADEVQRVELRPTGFYQRMAEGRGEYLTPGQIEASNARYPQQLFWGMTSAATLQASHDDPGIWNDVVVIRSRSGGSCRPSVFVDGVWIRAENMGDGESLADLVHKEDLLGVEVYQWPFGVPPQYAGKQSCGVVLFWTDFN